MEFTPELIAIRAAYDVLEMYLDANVEALMRGYLTDVWAASIPQEHIDMMFEFVSLEFDRESQRRSRMDEIDRREKERLKREEEIARQEAEIERRYDVDRQEALGEAYN
jgi:hypothetical protein